MDPEESLIRQKAENGQQYESTFLLGQFIVDIEVVSIEDIKYLRKFVPKEEYRLVKNRMCARLSRRKRKETSHKILSTFDQLAEENEHLKQMLFEA